MTAGEDLRCSAFALDVHWTSGERAGVALTGHVDRCARCRAYLGELEVLGAPASETATVPLATNGMPGVGLHRVARVRRERGIDRFAGRGIGKSAGAESVAIGGRSPRERLVRRPAPKLENSSSRILRIEVLALTLGVPLAAAILLYFGQRAAFVTGYLGVVGTPAVQLLVHRDGELTSVWDGRSSIQPGDSLALRVACEGMSHVSVATPRGFEWERLTDGACAGPAIPLPFTLVVDDASGSERFAVVVSRAHLDDRALAAAAATMTRSTDIWTLPFELPKSRGDRR